MVQDIPFGEFFKKAGIFLESLNPYKEKKYLVNGGYLNIHGLVKRIKASELYEFGEVMELTKDPISLAASIDKYCEESGIIANKPKGNEASRKLLEGLVLYKDISFTLDKEPEYFLATEGGLMSDIPAHHYLQIIKPENPALEAQIAVMQYSPRNKLGIFHLETPRGTVLPHINSYIPPKWMGYDGNLPDSLPKDFKTLIWHLFPEGSERKFFFHWVYTSLTSRADTYLVLQGAPAIGKNRLKLFLRALHGELNTVDGKKSTLTTQFNGQLAENTLVWFDELKYGPQDENTMKEIPNGTMSIERKYENSTRSSQIHCSLVISNNKPRDNYLSFDARKFSPLNMTCKRLDTIMSPAEILEMSKKVESSKEPEFDITYISQIGRWILKHGKDESRENCEYRGPKFWIIAHANMSAWQKYLIEAIFGYKETTDKVGTFLSSGKFPYGEFIDAYMNTKKVKRGRRPDLPDISTARVFFEQFRDLDGKKVFKITSIPRSVIGDFYIAVVGSPRLFDFEAEEEGTDLL